MPEKDIDQIIKDKLTAWQIPFAPEDWNAMQAKLDQLFDDEMRQKLDGALIPFSEHSWDEMAELLDSESVPHAENSPFQEANPSANSEDPFLDALKSKLDQYPVPFIPASDWEVLASRMDGQSFDSSIRQSLENYSIPFHYTDWYDMEDRLEAPFDSRLQESLKTYQVQFIHKDWASFAKLMAAEGLMVPGRILSSKWTRVAVAAALAFLILFSGGWWIRNSTPSQFALYGPENASPEQGLAENRTTIQNHLNHMDVRDEEILTFTEKRSSTRSSAQHNVHQDITPQSVRTKKFDLVNPAQLDVRQNIVQANLEEERTKPESEPEEPSPKEIIHSYQIRSLPAMYRSALAEDQIESNHAFVPGFDRNGIDVSIGLYGAYASTRAELNGPSSRLGYMAGVRADFTLNDHWSIVGGVNYGEKNFFYAYRRTDTYDSVAVEGNLRMIDIPIMARYKFSSENDLKLYIQGGIVGALSLNESYSEYNPRTPQNRGVQNFAPSGLVSAEANRKLNTYPANVIVSFGIEYPLGKGFSVQLEPYFLQNLQRTKESERLNIRKRLYTAGVGATIMFDPKP